MENSSLKKQIILTFLIIILMLIGVDTLCNRYLLGNYYLKTKEDIILEVADTINKNIDNVNDIDFLNSLERSCYIQNLSLLVIDENCETFLYLYNKEDETEIIKRVKMYIAENINNEKKYMVSTITNTSLNVNYMEICGKLSNGYYYIIKTPIEAIQESVTLSIKFLLYTFIILLPVSIVIMLILSEQITQPINNLAHISKNIANLDFSKRCNLDGSIETIELGNNFNQMAETLEKTIGELKTANAQLEEDIQKRTQMEEMRRDFSSSVSHELKTPIAIISGYAECLKDDVADPEDVKFYADTIFEESQKLSDMVQQILKINKMEYQNNNANIEKLNICNIVNTILSPMSNIIKEKTIQVKNNIPENLYGWSDNLMLNQIISNYITNAIDHVNIGGTLLISFEELENKYKIKVFNTGSSIEEKYLNNIWDKFFKIDKSRNREFGGTGLGLAIVKTYAISLGQEYGVENKENGIEFFITIDK